MQIWSLLVTGFNNIPIYFSPDLQGETDPGFVYSNEGRVKRKEVERRFIDAPTFDFSLFQE